MCRLRRLPFALVALLFVASSAVGLLAIGRGGAVSPASQVDVAALTTEIQKQDAAFFGAFNAHELEAMMAFFAADLEFYHDKDGRLSFDQVNPPPIPKKMSLRRGTQTLMYGVTLAPVVPPLTAVRNDTPRRKRHGIPVVLT